MERQPSTFDGAGAGIVAGASVIALFLVYDALRMNPVATPMEFARVLFGVEGPDLGVTDLGSGGTRAATIATAVFRLIAYTGLHFLVFAGLGVLAARLFAHFKIPPNAFTGALYGLTACSAVLFAAFVVVWPPVTGPSVLGVLIANACAGAIIGIQLRGGRKKPESLKGVMF